MKFLLALTILSTALVLTAADSVTYVANDKVAASLGKSATLVTTSDVRVSGSHRDQPGESEVHDKETDTMFVTDGEATLVTGGTMVGGKVTAPNQHRGTGITGGQTHRLKKGDVIVIPAGIPHWFKEVPKSVSYYVVKALKP